MPLYKVSRKIEDKLIHNHKCDKINPGTKRSAIFCNLFGLAQPMSNIRFKL